MGFTHYFRRPTELDKETFKKFAADVRKLFKAAAKKEEKIYLANGRGLVGTSPRANIEGVIFNGMDFSERGGDDESHETLYIPRVVKLEEWQKPEKGLCFNFCKTARKPYDLVVVAVLVAFKKHFPKVELSSDGDQEDWKDGIEFCQEVLDYGENFKIEN